MGFGGLGSEGFTSWVKALDSEAGRTAPNATMAFSLELASEGSSIAKPLRI